MIINKSELQSILATAQRLENRGLKYIEFCFDVKPYVLGRLSDEADSRLSVTVDGLDYEVVVWNASSESEVLSIVFAEDKFEAIIDFVLDYMKGWGET